MADLPLMRSQNFSIKNILGNMKKKCEKIIIDSIDLPSMFLL